jgi:hypothetical protein
MSMNVSDFIQGAKDLIKNKEVNNLYITNEDFGRTDETLPRVLVLGCLGSGKSTLLNKMAGFRLHCVEGEGEDEDEFVWDNDKDKDDDKPLFESNSNVDSVTKYTSFANVHFLGDSEKPVILVDTPGHDHPESSHMDLKLSRQSLAENAADLYEKLKRMGHLNTILVMHNDVHSNRLNPATYTLLQKIDEMFSSYPNDENDTNDTIWNHVVIAYSKCDSDSRGWRCNLSNKKQQLQKEIRKRFPTCQVDVPVLTLSGVNFKTDVDKKTKPRTRTKINREKVINDSELEAFYQIVNNSNAFSTSNIQKFKGLDVRLEQFIQTRDLEQRLNNARLCFNVVMFQIVMLLFCLLIRNMITPFLNINGMMDELLIFMGFVYLVGPVKCSDWSMIAWKDYITPKLKTIQLPQQVKEYIPDKYRKYFDDSSKLN